MDKLISFSTNFKDTLLSLVKITLMSKWFMKKPQKNGDHKEIVVIGNGPSLNEFVENHSDFFQGKAKICVNLFSRSDFFQQIQPEYYVLASMEFWNKDKLDGRYEDRFKTFELIAERTNWPMVLIVPIQAKKHDRWKEVVGQNKNVSIQYFNKTPVQGFSSTEKWAMRKNLGMPRPHNVLIPTLIQALNLGYERLYVLGADHSWLKEIKVPDSGIATISQKHFYESQKTHVKSMYSNGTAQPMYYGGTGVPRKLHDILLKFYYTFRAYWVIKNYSDSIGVEIINLTKDSYIDAFEKRTLENT